MADVERALRDAATAVEFPPTPDVASAVAGRLPARRRRRPLVIAVAAAALALAVALAVPPARSALLRFLGLRGVTIERVEDRPVFDMRTGRPLGVQVSLANARRRAGFRVHVPAGEDFSSVSFDGRYPGGAVTFGWPRPRILLTQFRGSPTPHVAKRVGPGTGIDLVDVDGALGYWLAGERHRVVFSDARGRVIESRAAGNVLLWERGGVTFRLEGDVTLQQALRIARSLR